MRILEKLAARNAETPDRAAALIACLGDSVTHGCFEVFKNRFGKVDTVYRPEGGYPARLRRRLNLLYPASAVNVLNAGRVRRFVGGRAEKARTRRAFAFA